MAIREVFIRTPYNYDVDEASRETGLKCVKPTLTQQHMRDDCDINVMLKRFGHAAAIPQGFRVPQYGDFSHNTTYHDAMNSIAAAGEAFDSLPAAIRDRFRNDPAQFVDFCFDEKNRDELTRLGLITAPTTASSTPADVGVTAAVSDAPEAS